MPKRFRTARYCHTKRNYKKWRKALPPKRNHHTKRNNSKKSNKRRRRKSRSNISRKAGARTRQTARKQTAGPTYVVPPFGPDGRLLSEPAAPPAPEPPRATRTRQTARKQTAGPQSTTARRMLQEAQAARARREAEFEVAKEALKGAKKEEEEAEEAHKQVQAREGGRGEGEVGGAQAGTGEGGGRGEGEVGGKPGSGLG